VAFIEVGWLGTEGDAGGAHGEEGGRGGEEERGSACGRVSSVGGSWCCDSEGGVRCRSPVAFRERC
jgi:hypothetical protein